MLGRKSILSELKKGTIVIEPFNIKQLGPNSYDVRLGESIFRTKERNHKVIPYIDITKESIWNPIEEKNIKYICLSPEEYILASTQEIIGAKTKFSTLLKSRSTIARQGLQVCASAGFGDVGYANIWTLEIKNDSGHYLAIPIGIRIAQVSFYKIDGEDGTYEGAYKQQIKWDSSQMLPKLGPERF